MFVVSKILVLGGSKQSDGNINTGNGDRGEGGVEIFKLHLVVVILIKSMV